MEYAKEKQFKAATTTSKRTRLGKLRRKLFIRAFAPYAILRKIGMIKLVSYVSCDLFCSVINSRLMTFKVASVHCAKIVLGV